MAENFSDGRYRNHVKPGYLVEVVRKNDQRTGNLTEGLVKRILTNASFHPHGIKVMLDNGEIGRVQRIIPE